MLFSWAILKYQLSADADNFNNVVDLTVGVCINLKIYEILLFWNLYLYHQILLSCILENHIKNP